MDKIQIKRNPNGDTRTAKADVSFEEFQTANDMHIEDVRLVMKKLGHMLREAGSEHDYSKKSLEDLFYENFKKTLDNGADFVSSTWYQWHIHAERHHPLAYCHDDFNLLDLMEMVSDCVCAAKARSGDGALNMTIPDELLQMAFTNTVKLVDDMTELVEEETTNAENRKF